MLGVARSVAATDARAHARPARAPPSIRPPTWIAAVPAEHTSIPASSGADATPSRSNCCADTDRQTLAVHTYRTRTFPPPQTLSRALVFALKRLGPTVASRDVVDFLDSDLRGYLGCEGHRAKVGETGLRASGCRSPMLVNVRPGRNEVSKEPGRPFHDVVAELLGIGAGMMNILPAAAHVATDQMSTKPC